MCARSRLQPVRSYGAACHTYLIHAVGDISLGCWTDSQQAKQTTGPEAVGNSPAVGATQPQCCNMAGMSDGEPQPSTAAAGCGDMDLTNYFATLPNEVIAFKDLVAPSPVSSHPVHC